MSTTSDKTYNGWTNYETWAVGLYLDGNYTGEHTYREVLELADDHKQSMRADECVYSLADALKNYVESELDLGDTINGLASDLLSAAMSEINWRELAEAKLQEVSES